MSRTRLLAIAVVALAVLGGCTAAPKVIKVDQYIWPKESPDPKLKALRVITNSDEFPGQDGTNPLLKELIGDVGTTWIEVNATRLATDGNGVVYIASPRFRTLQKVDFHAKSISNIRFDSAQPSAIDVAPDGRIFIGDRAGGRVAQVSEDKKFLWAYGRGISDAEYAAFKNDRNRDTTGFYKDISDIYYDNGKLYVADQLLNRIDVLSAKGALISSYRNIPAPIAVFRSRDASDKLYALSKIVGKLYELDEKGGIVREMLEPGDNIWAMNFPNGADTDSDGNIYIIDTAAHGMKIYSQSGDFLYYLGAEEPSIYLGGFNNPKDIVIDSKDRIYILDAFNRRLVVLEYLGGKYETSRQNLDAEEPMLRR